MPGEKADVTELGRLRQRLAECEARYRDVFDNALDAVFLLDVEPDGRHFRTADVNPALVRLTGIPRSESVGKLQEEIVPAETAESVNVQFRSCVEARHPIVDEIFLDLPGGRRWYRSTLVPTFDETGRVARIIGITRDVTERRMVERELGASEERFRRAFGDSLVGMALLAVDSTPRFQYAQVNNALSEFLGLTEDRLIGLCQRDVLEPAGGEAAGRAFDELLAGSRVRYRAEHRFVRAGGDTVWAVLSATLLRNVDGTPMYVLAQAEDITARKHTERELQLRVDELSRVQQELAERESRYRDVFENVLDSLYLLEVTPDGEHFRNLEINPALERSTGIPREQMIGKLQEEVVPPEVAEAVNTKYRTCVEAGHPIQEEVELELPSGRRWYDSTLIPARDHTGRVYRIVGITRDITERREFERALAHSEERFRLAFDGSLIGMTLSAVDSVPAFRHVRLNQAMCDFLGCPEGRLRERLWSEVIAPDDVAVTIAAFEQLLAGELATYRAETRFVTAYGSQVWGLLNATLVRDPDDAPLYILTQVEDITERKRTEEELERRVAERTAQLEAINRDLDSFNYSASHDLRAPLRAISGYLTILLSRHPDLPEDAIDMVQRAVSRTASMNQLIDDLLDFSRLSRAEVTRERIDMAALVGEVLDELSGPAAERHAEVTVGPLDDAVGDRSLVRQVWVNLLGNALKFSSVRERPQVRVESEVTDGTVGYRVTDNGVGFDQAYADKLFGVFERLHGSAFPGTGIGLAIVKGVVTRHGGTVWATGEPERGACITFTLPAYRPESGSATSA